MLYIKCKQCGIIISTEYTPLLDTKIKKYLSKLQYKPSDDCSTSIYLQCDNDHLEKYYCKIETNK